jgi:diacylglycerol kinase family enzyme
LLLIPELEEEKPNHDGTALTRLLKKRANFPFEVHFTTRSREAETVSLQAIRSHFERVIAVGGDGIVNEIINGVLGNDVVIGILPFGTGNDLARSIGAKNSYKALLNMLRYPRETSLNVANVNGRLTLLVSDLMVWWQIISIVICLSKILVHSDTLSVPLLS